jgi:hypothetical protein
MINIWFVPAGIQESSNLVPLRFKPFFGCFSEIFFGLPIKKEKRAKFFSGKIGYRKCIGWDMTDIMVENVQRYFYFAFIFPGAVVRAVTIIIITVVSTAKSLTKTIL